LYCQECGNEVGGNFCSECGTIVEPIQSDLEINKNEFYKWGQSFAKKLGFLAIIIVVSISSFIVSLGNFAVYLLPVFVFAILVSAKKSVNIIIALLTVVLILAFFQLCVGLFVKPELFYNGLISGIFTIYILYKIRKFQSRYKMRG